MAISEKYRPGRIAELADSESVLIEESRRLLVAHGLLSREQVLFPLPNDPTLRKHNNGSNAIYIVEQEIDPSVVYISTLEPSSATSGHSHPGREKEHEHKVFESYVCVRGEATLILEDKDEIPLRQGQSFKVWPGVKHQVKTNGGPAVLAIVMENGAKYPKDKRHIT